MKVTEFLQGRDVERQAVTRYINRHEDLFKGHTQKVGKEIELDAFAVEQLAEVYGIDEERYNSLYPWFKVDTTRIRPLRVNQLSYKELLRHPYLNSSQVRQLDRLRRKAPLQSWNDFILLEEFSTVDYQRLRPYLSFE